MRDNMVSIQAFPSMNYLVKCEFSVSMSPPPPSLPGNFTIIVTVKFTKPNTMHW